MFYLCNMHVYENEMKMAMKLFLLQAKLNRYIYLLQLIFQIHSMQNDLQISNKRSTGFLQLFL